MLPGITSTSPGGSDANEDLWMFACDLDANKLWCGVNGVWTSGDSIIHVSCEKDSR